MKRVDLRSGRLSLSEACYKYILDAMLTYELKPGDRLQPEEIAAATGLSPTPVKVALSTLAGEGYVEFRPGQGTYVKLVSKQEFLHLFDARRMIEIYAVQEGFAQVDDEFVDRAALLVSRIEEAYSALDGSYETTRRHVLVDTEFHVHLVSLHPNPTLIAWHRQLNVNVRQVLFNNYGRPEQSVDLDLRKRRLAGTNRGHHEILGALRRRDADGAVAAVRRHIDESRQTLLALHEG
jgi:DNA-binding GntR family transcriptional regulator